MNSLAEMPKKGTVRKIVQEFDPRRHVSCQCTVKISKIDVCCQCDANTTAWDSNVRNVVTNGLVSNLPTCQTWGFQVPNIPIENHHSKQVVTNTVSGMGSTIISMHSAAQTSDVPIDLNNARVQQYPFFMKIVCAEKLCEDCNIIR